MSGENQVTVWDTLDKEEWKKIQNSDSTECNIPNLVACIKELKQLVETYEHTKRECCTDHEKRIKILEDKS